MRPGKKAITYYERLLQTAPQSDQAAYACRVLPRLKLGIDTGQRRSTALSRTNICQASIHTGVEGLRGG